MDNTRESLNEANDGLWANYIFHNTSDFSKLDLMMNNPFLGMETGFRTRPDRPRPRKTWTTVRKKLNKSEMILFFRPLGLRTRRPAGEDPDVKIWRSKGLTPWFYVVFYGATLENHRTKQMMVYEQIPFYIKTSNFSKLDLMTRNRFLGIETGFRTRPDRPRPRKTWKTDRKTRNIRFFFFNSWRKFLF